MKLAGIIFIVLSAGSVGLQISISMKTRCRYLRQIQAAVQLLKNEIIVCSTPLPQAFALMAASLHGSMETVFSRIAHELNQRRWMTVSAAMEEAINLDMALKNDDELSDVFRCLAKGLGKYDKDSQLSILDGTLNRLEKMIDEAEKERSIKSKTYEILGICAGLSIVILLI